VCKNVPDLVEDVQWEVDFDLNSIPGLSQRRVLIEKVRKFRHRLRRNDENGRVLKSSEAGDDVLM